MAVFALAVLLLVSTDSWTHCLYDHHDSATFFASGKAWMSGMVPYVDFSDSKGPLLWLIYGVGYLLSPRSVAGMFWISVVAYSFIFWWLYKTARIYLGDDRCAMMASMATAISIFFPVVRYETRAEDFALFFMVWALYHVCRLLHDDEVEVKRQTVKASIVLGIGMAGTMLIKYNVSVILGVMALFVIHSAWRRYTFLNLWQSLALMALSASLFLAPFIIYMLEVGCFDDFIREYFVVNMEVVARQHQQMRHPIFMLIGHRYSMGFFLLANALSALAAARYTPHYRYFIITVFAATLLLTVTNAFWLYYYAICAPFLLFGLVAVSRFLLHLQGGVNSTPLPLQGRGWVRGVAILLVITVTAMHLVWGGSWWFKGKPEQQTFDRYVEIMSHIQRPRVIYCGMHGMAFGIPAHSLPGCKYWVSQSGSTPDMDRNQLQAIEHRKADFIFVLKSHDNPTWYHTLGYHRHPNDNSLPALMYSRDSLTTDLAITVTIRNGGKPLR